MQDSELRKPTRDLLAESAQWLEEQYPYNHDGASLPNKKLEQRKVQTRLQLERIREEEGGLQLDARYRYPELDSFTMGPSELEDSKIYEVSASSPVPSCPAESVDRNRSVNDLHYSHSEIDEPLDQVEQDQGPPAERAFLYRSVDPPLNGLHQSPQTIQMVSEGHGDKKSKSWPPPTKCLPSNYMDAQNNRASRYSSRSAPIDYTIDLCNDCLRNGFAEQNPQSFAEFSALIPVQKSDRPAHQSLFAGLDRLIGARPARFPPQYKHP